MSANLARLLTDTASKHGDRPALKLDDTVVTYNMLNEGAARVCGLLKSRGVQPGDRVGHHAAERAVFRGRLLRRAARGRPSSCR